jgi:uncharacterized Zn finger protein
VSDSSRPDRKRVSLGERWRQIGARDAAESVLEQSLATLPSIRHPKLRIRPGSIQTEMEGAMGSINEVSIHTSRLPDKIWPQVARIMRRSPSMVAAMQQGRVPRAFDRLLLRVCGESVFPDPRRVTHGCTCGSPESPCIHVLALHELFARRLDERPYELLGLRGVDLRSLLEDAQREPAEGELPPLAFGAVEEPVLFPEAEESELDGALSVGEVRDLLATHQRQIAPHVDAALSAYVSGEETEGETPSAEDAGSEKRAQASETSRSRPVDGSAPDTSTAVSDD